LLAFFLIYNTNCKLTIRLFGTMTVSLWKCKCNTLGTLLAQNGFHLTKPQEYHSQSRGWRRCGLKK